MESLKEMRYILTEEMADIIKEECEKRIDKYGLTSPGHGACKGCRYKYIGDNPLMCCMFANLPCSWK